MIIVKFAKAKGSQPQNKAHGYFVGKHRAPQSTDGYAGQHGQINSAQQLIYAIQNRYVSQSSSESPFSESRCDSASLSSAPMCARRISSASARDLSKSQVPVAEGDGAGGTGRPLTPSPGVT